MAKVVPDFVVQSYRLERQMLETARRDGTRCLYCRAPIVGHDLDELVEHTNRLKEIK